MINMNIIEFIEDKSFLNDQSLSVAQRTALKAVYGLPLTGEEFKVFGQITGLKNYPIGREWEEASFILGRRSGKSDKIASSIALYEACCREHKLSVGQTGVVMVVASEKKRQAQIVYKYIRDKLKRSPILRKMIAGITQECISLTNGVEIWVYPCSIGRVRGVSLIAFIGDECAHWKVEGKDVDVDVLDSARPGLDFDYSKMIKISTPYMMRGEIWLDYKQYYGKPNDDILVFQGDTKLFNPTYSERKLRRLKKRKPLTYRTEHEAFFRTDISSMYDPFIIDKAINRGRPLEIPYRDGQKYRAFVDVAGGGGKDSYSLAIGHLENEKVIVDLVRSRAPKFNPDEVTAQHCELLKGYKIDKVYGDKWSGDWASNSFAKHGISYERSEKTKSELYLEAESPFNVERVDLPNKELLITQLKNLVRKTRSGGKDSVDTDSGQPEDEANVCAGLIFLMVKKPGPVPRIWRVGGDEPRRETSRDDWPEFRRLSDEKLEKKLGKLPEDKMLELYKKLERESGFRIDPENYKSHRIVKNFMILWTSKIENERREDERGAVLVPMSDDEVGRIMGTQGSRISGRTIRISRER